MTLEKRGWYLRTYVSYDRINMIRTAERGAAVRFFFGYPIYIESYRDFTDAFFINAYFLINRALTNSVNSYNIIYVT